MGSKGKDFMFAIREMKRKIWECNKEVSFAFTVMEKAQDKVPLEKGEKNQKG